MNERSLDERGTARRKACRWCFFAFLFLFAQSAPARAPDSLDELVRDLSVELPWLYRKVDENIGANPARVPPVVARKVIEEDSEAARKRRDAAARLKRLGTNAWPAVPKLVNQLQQENLTVRVASADVLAALNADQSPLWNTCINGITERKRAAEALQWLLKGHDEFLRPYSTGHRRFALVGLSAVGPAAKGATSDVAAVLASKEMCELWPLAMTALNRLGGDVLSVLPSLRATLQDKEEWPAVSALAARALAAVKPAEAQTLEALQSALGDARSLVGIRAAEALWQLGRPAEELLPVLLRGTAHRLASVRLASVETLALIGKPAAGAEDAVRKLLSDPEEGVRSAAALALEKIGDPRR